MTFYYKAIVGFALCALVSNISLADESFAPDKASILWLDHEPGDSIAQRFVPPPGFHRQKQSADSYAYWLRRTPLLPGNPQVLLFNGAPKYRQDVHAAVLDLDVDPRDLQQCADAVMRLRAEFLFGQNKMAQICFSTANGYRADWGKWRRGYRPPRGKNGPWVRSARGNNSYKGFREYMLRVFGTANTASLFRQLVKVNDPSQIEIGDVFIQPASKNGYGHAVIVMDVAQNSEGDRRFLISQSYMPAQQSHILKNPNDADLSPWYHTTSDGSLLTPEWTFETGALKRFSTSRCPGR